MLLSLAARDLVHAAWEVEREDVSRVLPPGLEPAEIDGKHFVSLFALRAGNSRLERLPVPRFSQLTVGAHVRFRSEPAVFFLLGRVTPAGLGAALFGLPYRPARLRVRKGVVHAAGLGVSLSYEERGATDPGELEGAHLGLMEAAGLRTFRIRRASVSWMRGELVDEARADPLLALGFDVGDPAALLYARSASLEIELPLRKATSSGRG